MGASTTVLGAAVLSAGDWLGGHLAYARCRRRHHGIPGAPGGLGAHRSGAAAGHGRPELVRVHGIDVLVLRIGDDLMAMEDRCTHRGDPLREGGVVRDGVMRSGS